VEISETIGVVGVSALVIATVLIVYFARRQNPHQSLPILRTGSMPRVAPQGIIYNDAPTVRVTQHERFNRVRKKVALHVGEKSQAFDSVQGSSSAPRLALHAIENGAARFSLDLGSATAICGPSVRECAPNEFSASPSSADDQRSSVFYLREGLGSLAFMRVVLTRLDDATAEFDVLTLSGVWHGNER
jgi:hypothetical protein